MEYLNIQNQDPVLYEIIKREEQRQKEGIELIASENYVTPAVLEAMGSILTNKYSEDNILADLRDYVDSTYADNSHYLTDSNDDIQCLDVWLAREAATQTFVNTAIKYLWRYGRKEGNNKKDLMKALHYIMFALHNDHYKKG